MNGMQRLTLSQNFIKPTKIVKVPWVERRLLSSHGSSRRWRREGIATWDQRESLPTGKGKDGLSRF